MKLSLTRTMLQIGKLRFLYYISWHKRNYVSEIQWDYGKYAIVMGFNSKFTYFTHYRQR